ncbi:cartilage matrix protein-like [Porites lutea]|uniref:cartilage matrix protein-like n=1 Tax=Porites lutea TaxID=51062 RepID=UPI003CC691C7
MKIRTEVIRVKMNCWWVLPLLVVAVNFGAEGKQKICGKKIDLAIVLDASASIGEENFKLGKDFAKRLIKRFTISKDKVQVSVIAYSQYINIASRFNDNNDEKSLDNTLDNIFYEASSSGTGKTLEAVNFEVFTEKSGARSGRPGVKKVTVVVTDGWSGIGTDMVKEKVGQMKRRGIEMFAVGITNSMKDEELQVISSRPLKHHFFRLTDSMAENQIIDSIVTQVC